MRTDSRQSLDPNNTRMQPSLKPDQKDLILSDQPSTNQELKEEPTNACVDQYRHKNWDRNGIRKRMHILYTNPLSTTSPAEETQNRLSENF